MAPKSKLKIDDRVWRKLQRKLQRARRVGVNVGMIASKGGNQRTESGITLAELAAIHEFGSPSANIPERSFIRRTFDEGKKEFEEISAKVAKGIILDRFSVEKGMEILGAWGANAVKKRVTSGEHIPPPLKAATIAAKGSDRPLVDTGVMINAISWEIVDRES